MLKNFPIFLDDYIDGYIRFSADILPKFLKVVYEDLKDNTDINDKYLSTLISELVSLSNAAKLLRDVHGHVFMLLNKKINAESINKDERFDSQDYIIEIVNILTTLEEKLKDILELGLKSPETGTYDSIYFEPIVSYLGALEIMEGYKNVESTQ